MDQIRDKYESPSKNADN
jgi:hypothetical protein